MEWAESAMSRVREHQSKATAFKTMPADSFSFEYTKNVPILNRPRLTVRLPLSMTFSEIRDAFEKHGYGHLWAEWVGATGSRIYSTDNENSVPNLR
jgi:hypothetical protein